MENVKITKQQLINHFLNNKTTIEDYFKENEGNAYVLTDVGMSYVLKLFDTLGITEFFKVDVDQENFVPEEIIDKISNGHTSPMSATNYDVFTIGSYIESKLSQGENLLDISIEMNCDKIDDLLIGSKPKNEFHISDFTNIHIAKSRMIYIDAAGCSDATYIIPIKDGVPLCDLDEEYEVPEDWDY